MKTKAIMTPFAVFLSALAFSVVVLTVQASAAVDTCTWAGAGADSNFSTGANWTGCDNGGVPENGDSLAFDVAVFTDNATVTNDMTDLDIAGLNLTGSNGATPSTYSIEGNSIILSGDITSDNDEYSGYLNLNVDIVLGSDIAYSAVGSSIRFGEYANIGVNTLDLQTHNVTIDTPASCGLHIYGSLMGSGDIVSSAGAEYIALRAPSSSYTGNVVSNGAGVDVRAGALGADNTVTMNSGTLFLVDTEEEYMFDVIMNSSADPAIRATPFGVSCGGGGAPETATVTLAGDLTLQQDTIFRGSPHNLEVTGVFTDNGYDVVLSEGSVGSFTTSQGVQEGEEIVTTIDADDKTTDTVYTSGKETIVLNGERASVYVAIGGTLKGTGVVTGVVNIVSGATLAPGLSPGCLSTGDLTLSGTYQVEIEGSTVCSEYDQTDVTGTVDVTDATLEVSFLNDYTPAEDDEFVIINNDGTDAVTGEFTGMANGDSFEIDGTTFRIQYDGGDGNDVVLTAVTVPGVPDTGVETIVQSGLAPIAAVIASVAVLGALRAYKQHN